MLFGTWVVHVEGLAEALLMPAFANLVLDTITDEAERRRDGGLPVSMAHPTRVPMVVRRRQDD